MILLNVCWPAATRKAAFREVLRMKCQTDPSVIKMMLVVLALAGTSFIFLHVHGVGYLPWEFQAMVAGLTVVTSFMGFMLLLLPIMAAQELYRLFVPIQDQAVSGGSLRLQ